MRTFLLANCDSGGWGRCQPELERLAAQTGSPIRGHKDQSFDQILDEARREGCRRIIVAGGDGSLSRVVNQAAAYLDEIELALIPTGTGNDLARSIGIFGASIEQAWEWAVTRPAVAIDLMKITDGDTHYIANAATGGFGGVVSTDVAAEDKQRWGAIAYWMTAFFKLASLDQFSIRLELDHETVSLETYGLAITNGRYVGGGFPVAPTAIVNDGLLDVAVVGVLPTLDLLAVGAEFALGQYDQPDRVTTYRSSRVKVHAEPAMPYSMDGEPTRSIDADFEIVPQALHIVCGPEPIATNLPDRKKKIVA